MVLRARPIATKGRPMPRVRVIARGAGVRASAITGATGYARMSVRPRSSGVLTVRVVGSTRCVKRMGVAGEFRPAALTG